MKDLNGIFQRVYDKITKLVINEGKNNLMRFTASGECQKHPMKKGLHIQWITFCLKTMV